MPRKSIPSNALPAQVRRYLGLEQQELAAYLGISRQYVADIEAGRRTLTSRVLLRLNPLAALLPAERPARPAPPAPDVPPPGTPAPGPLEARLDVCLHRAGQLRRQLAALAAPYAQARRWQQVLPGLLAAAEAAPAATDGRARQWLLRRQAAAAALLNAPDLAADYHLLRVRAEALEHEAAALAALLAGGGSLGREREAEKIR